MRPGSNVAILGMNDFMTPRVNHCGYPFSTICDDRMRFESGFGCDAFSADRAASVLLSPNRNQSVSALGAVQHTFPVPFFKISVPFFVIGIGFANDFLESNDFCVGGSDQRQILLLVIISSGELHCKRPSSSVDSVPIFIDYPFPVLMLVSALRPSPQA